MEREMDVGLSYTQWQKGRQHPLRLADLSIGSLIASRPGNEGAMAIDICTKRKVILDALG